MATEFDSIVIGAGLGGLCCAGELVVQGMKPLLISETREVGAALAAPLIAGNRAVRQAPTWQVAWGDGGWWPALARRLNANVRVPMGFNVLGYDLFIKGDDTLHSIPQTVLSAGGLTEAFCGIFPQLADLAGELQRVIGVALAIPYQELADMDEVPFLHWLQEQSSDELVVATLNSLCNSCIASGSSKFCREHVSAFGAIGGLRSVFFGEACYGYVYPDVRRGLAHPLADAIERQGGTVWRGRKVIQVGTQAGRVGPVVLDDGTEVRAPVIALACTNQRTAEMLESIPPEAEPALAYGEQTLHRDWHAFAVLDREVMPPHANAWRGVVNPDGSLHSWSFSVHTLPWHMGQGKDATGKQLVVAARTLPVSEAFEVGTDEEIFAELHRDMDFYNPGYADATIEVGNYSHKGGHLWFENLFAGPKLPRRAESVEGLYFVGQGSKPNQGFYMESGASAGILGARQIAAEREPRGARLSVA
jgi:phytoene dehydrogenase-like protein